MSPEIMIFIDSLAHISKTTSLCEWVRVYIVSIILQVVQTITFSILLYIFFGSVPPLEGPAFS